MINAYKELPGVRLLQTFGTSETGILRTSSKSSDSLFFKTDDPDREHKIVDGELYIRKICREKLENYKVPSKFIFDDAIGHSTRFQKL